MAHVDKRASDHVRLVVLGKHNEGVGGRYVGVALQHLKVVARRLDDGAVDLVAGKAHLLGRVVDKYDVRLLVRQGLCQLNARVARAYYDNFHVFLSAYCYLTGKSKYVSG